MKAQLQRNLHFAVRASVDSQEENGLIWKQLQTAGISVRKRWSGIMRQKKDGRKRRLPEKARQPKREAARYRETSEVAEESLDGFSRRSKANRKGNVC